MDEMQCVAAVAQWCSAVKVNGCVARRREMQLVAWLAVYGGGNDHGWGGGGEMEAVSGNGCRTAVEVKGKMREKSRHSGPIWVRDCVVRTLSRRS